MIKHETQSARKRSGILSIATLIGCGMAWGQPAGTLDATFGTNGIVQTNFGAGMNVTPLNAFEQATGDIVVIGSFTTPGSAATSFGLVRYAANGQRDMSFGNKGITITTLGPQNSSRAVAYAVQPNGAILIGGTISTFTVGSTSSAFGVARYTANGVLDNTFGEGGVVTASTHFEEDTLSTVLLQPNGQIVVSGFVGGQGNNQAGPSNVMIRYNTDGTLDATFGTNGIALSPPITSGILGSALALLSNGNYLAVANNGQANVVANEYSSTGAAVSTNVVLPAGVTITAISNISTILFQSNGNFIVSANVTPPASAAPAGFTLGRHATFAELAGFTPAVAPTFTTTSFGFEPITASNITQVNESQGADLVFSNNAKTQIVMGGDLTGSGGGAPTAFALARFNQSNGSFVLDPTFGNGGKVVTAIGAGGVAGLMIQSNGNIVAVGTGTGLTTLVLARYLGN